MIVIIGDDKLKGYPIFEEYTNPVGMADIVSPEFIPDPCGGADCYDLYDDHDFLLKG